MEPRIIHGHSYLCKKSVVGGNRQIYYTKGNIYKCEVNSPYAPNTPNFKYTCGHITNNFGNTYHAWPYDPQNNPLCHDIWTEFFTEVKS